MADKSDIFFGDDPFQIVKRWFKEAVKTEINDPDAIALSTVDTSGMPNVRMVLLREIEAASFVFYTNYGSVKSKEIF
jgi:pyridoxamine 5'-phosphate oxidase